MDAPVPPRDLEPVRVPREARGQASVAQGQHQTLRLQRQSDLQPLLNASADQGGGAAAARAGQRDQRETPHGVPAGAQSLPSRPPGPLSCWWLLAGRGACRLSGVSKASHQGRWEPDPDRDGKGSRVLGKDNCGRWTGDRSATHRGRVGGHRAFMSLEV